MMSKKGQYSQPEEPANPVPPSKRIDADPLIPEEIPWKLHVGELLGLMLPLPSSGGVCIMIDGQPREDGHRYAELECDGRVLLRSVLDEPQDNSLALQSELIEVQKYLLQLERRLGAVRKWLEDPRSTVYSLAEILNMEVEKLKDGHANNGCVLKKKHRYEICKDCGVNVYDIGEAFYMVEKEIWEDVQGGEGVLCIGCLENRLGRSLTRSDFPDIAINRARSARLRSRIGE